MEVPLGNSHATNVDWEEYLCVNVDRFDVTLDCSTNYWVSGSYIYVYAELANSEEELILKARHDGYQNNQNTYYLRRFEVGISEQWYYQMGAVPGNWSTTTLRDGHRLRRALSQPPRTRSSSTRSSSL